MLKNKLLLPKLSCKFGEKRITTPAKTNKVTKNNQPCQETGRFLLFKKQKNNINENDNGNRPKPLITGIAPIPWK
jgi:hypothetical protein